MFMSEILQSSVTIINEIKKVSIYKTLLNKISCQKKTKTSTKRQISFFDKKLFTIYSIEDKEAT